MKQFNIVINTLFCGLSENKINKTLDIFWAEYTDLNDNNGPFNSDDFICSRK